MLGVMVLTTLGLLYYFRRRSLVGRWGKSIAQLLSIKLTIIYNP